VSVCREWCVLSGRCLRRADHSPRGVLPIVVCRCVWSRKTNLVIEEGQGPPGAIAPREKKMWYIQLQYFRCVNC